ncbi:MAG: hypothetical protein IJU19_08790 [Bacteroidales bacterium]|nr:hypothetical protein [Bacteroidales bacterium]
MALKNTLGWNTTLKFSWAHIIAFLALIFISYICYMGVFYSSGGNFTRAAIWMAVIDLVLLLLFIGLQRCKAADRKFDRFIIAERILAVLCPIAFIVCMIPFNHFWTVHSHRADVVSHFKEAISQSQKMFNDYDLYAYRRISSYSMFLSSVIADRNASPEAHQRYLQAGFNGIDDDIAREAYLTTLRLQLQSSATDSLRSSALQWIGRSNQGVSVWNAFLVGNIGEISQAIKGWDRQLTDLSSTFLTNEALDTLAPLLPFDHDLSTFNAANTHLQAMTNIYQNSHRLNPITLLLGLLLLAMLLLPYLIQERNSKSQKAGYTILPSQNAPQHSTPHPSQPSTGSIASNNNSDIYNGTL